MAWWSEEQIQLFKKQMKEKGITVTEVERSGTIFRPTMRVSATVSGSVDENQIRREVDRFDSKVANNEV